ncbi:Uncharacterised protein [Vibrio cholerae]|nr:Uncharacterised protein [Vibrio cholerae]CSA67700.1 Uncharacterised protein [Vibrio cholerae]CSD19702.1 Uncharacterised protein [Vibrio cholerae]CSI46187.1 Uncharacterised protein [Vibrio cholerae]
MHRARRVRECSLRMSAHTNRRFYRFFKIAHIVHRIKNTEYIHAIDMGALDKFLDDIIRVMTITE